MTELADLKVFMDYFGNLGALVLAAAALFHVIMTLRSKGRTDEVQSALYEQLRTELIDARTEIGRMMDVIGVMRDEKIVLREQIVTLQNRVTYLEECEETIHLLKLKLQQKDDTIAEQQLENKVLQQEISNLKDRIHHLELRLTQDEARFPRGDNNV